MSVTLDIIERLVYTQEFSVRRKSRVLFGITNNLNVRVSKCCFLSIHRGVSPKCYLV